jgi:hypothetical protein
MLDFLVSIGVMDTLVHCCMEMMVVRVYGCLVT